LQLQLEPLFLNTINSLIKRRTLWDLEHAEWHDAPHAERHDAIVNSQLRQYTKKLVVYCNGQFLFCGFRRGAEYAHAAS
jgi:hypothetical protein